MCWKGWNNLSAGSLLADCLAKLKQVGKEPSVLPWYRGPKKCGAPLGGWSLTSWSSLCSYSLCFSVPLRSQGIEGFEG